MLKIFIYLFTVIFLFSINAVLPPARSGMPNLLFLLVIFYSFRSEDAAFLWPAFFSGLLLDIYGNYYFGVFTLSFLVIALLVNYLTRTFFISDPSIGFMSAVVFFSYLILVGSFYLANSAAYSLHLALHKADIIYLKEKIWIDLLLNLIFALPVFFLAEMNDRIAVKFGRGRTNSL